MISLQNMRMACDNTWLIDHKTRFGPKIDELTTLVNEILEEPQAKMVVFSQWRTMTELAAEAFAKRGGGGDRAAVLRELAKMRAVRLQLTLTLP
jgi:ERCC4-related helicase